jgi:hypothetical protein
MDWGNLDDFIIKLESREEGFQGDAIFPPSLTLFLTRTYYAPLALYEY